MFKFSEAFSGFSVNNLAEAKAFYGSVLGINVSEDWMGLQLNLADSKIVFVYLKQDHVPAAFTILNFPTDDIDAAIDDLIAKGVSFLRYDNLPGTQDEKGVLRGKAANQGPDIAWFKDPAGNILSVLST